MIIELLRLEGDGERRFSTVVRDHDLSGVLAETTDAQAAHEPRHLRKLSTADEAAPVFMQYVEHLTAPGGHAFRLIADM